MEFKGYELIHSNQESVFDYLTNPENFSKGIPDIREVSVLGPDRFKIVAKLGISVIKAEFTILFTVFEKVPSSHVKLRGHGMGSGSAVDLDITVDLKGSGADATLNWTAFATVSGTLASLGQRVLGAVAERLVKDVFANIHAALESQDSKPTL